MPYDTKVQLKDQAGNLVQLQYFDPVSDSYKAGMGPQSAGGSPTMFVAPTAAKTSSYTIAPIDYMLRGDATSGAVMMTLPAASTVPGQLFAVKKIDASGNTVTVRATGAELIDGSPMMVFTTRFSGCVVQSNGTSWDVLSYVGG